MTPCRIIPPGPASLWYELREEYGTGPLENPPRLSELAELMGRTQATISNWLYVLEAAGFIERDRPSIFERRAITIKTCPDRPRYQVCKKCNRRECSKNSGDKCNRCKDAGRADRRWRKKAIHLATHEGLNEMQIYLRLQKEFPGVSLHDKPPDPDRPLSQGKKGIISVLADVALASPEWLEVQREGVGSLSQQRMRRVRNRREDHDADE